MKKALSVFLTLVMILSLGALAACKSEAPAATEAPATAAPAPTEKPAEATPSPEPTIDLDSAKPNAYIREKLAAGKKVTFAASLFTLDEQQYQIINDGLQRDMTAEGFEYVYANAGGDIVTQVNQCENFIQMGVSIIFCNLGEVEPFQAVCKAAQEAGIYFVIQGSWASFEPSGQAKMDQYEYGKVMGDAAVAWLDSRYPDAKEVKTAFLSTVFMADNINTIKGIQEKISVDPRINVVYTNENVTKMDEGFNAAQEAYTTDPDFRMLITITPVSGIGANNFITSIPDVKLDEYGIIFRGDNDATHALLDQGAANNGSCVRCLGGAGGNTFWETAEIICLGLLYGDFQAPYVTNERFYVLSNFGYAYDSRPAAK